MFRTFALNPPTPAKVPYNFDASKIYFSQVGQDKAVDEILNQKRGGFFTEVGAYDGLSLSNSIFFEKSRGWTGLLIEANPRAYRELRAKDSKAWSTPACISMSNQVELGATFLAHGMLGGYGNQGGSRFETNKFDRAKETDPYVYDIKTNCFPLNVMLDAIGVNHVDMFSLDVEGAELQVLQSIDWTKLTLLVLVVEVNGKGREIHDFMTAQGFVKGPIRVPHGPPVTPFICTLP